MRNSVPLNTPFTAYDSKYVVHIISYRNLPVIRRRADCDYLGTLASSLDDGQECSGDRASWGAAFTSTRSADLPPANDGLFLPCHAWNETLSRAVYDSCPIYRYYLGYLSFLGCSSRYQLNPILKSTLTREEKKTYLSEGCRSFLP